MWKDITFLVPKTAVVGHQCPAPNCDGILVFSQKGPYIDCNKLPLDHYRQANDEESKRLEQCIPVRVTV